MISGTENSEWFLIAELEIDKCWSEDDRATAISEYVNGIWGVNNMGNWVPCPDIPNARNIKGTGSGAITGGDINSCTINITVNVGNVVMANDIGWAGTSSSATTAIQKTDTLIGLVSSATTDTINFSPDPITYRDETDTSPITDTSGAGTRYAFVAAIASNKVATWYIPNYGVKIGTYQSRTGRLQNESM